MACIAPPSTPCALFALSAAEENGGEGGEGRGEEGRKDGEREGTRVSLLLLHTQRGVLSLSLSLSFFLLLAADIQAHCSDRPLWARCRFVHAILSYYKAAISGPLSCLTLVDTAQCSLFWLATGRKPTP